jgi:hypothetical protein
MFPIVLCDEACMGASCAGDRGKAKHIPCLYEFWWEGGRIEEEKKMCQILAMRIKKVIKYIFYPECHKTICKNNL